MTISPFGWTNNAPPNLNAQNLEAMLQDAGAYTDEETTRAEAAEAALAPLNNPHLTGIPTAPTAASGINNTQIATTQLLVRWLHSTMVSLLSVRPISSRSG